MGERTKNKQRFLLSINNYNDGGHLISTENEEYCEVLCVYTV